MARKTTPAAAPDARPGPAAAAEPPRLCPKCRLPIHPEATVCPHCGSDFATHPFWSRSGAYVPALSLVAAIVGMSPTLIDAVSRARNPPQAEIVVTEVHVDEPGLNLDLANFGAAMGVLESSASCRLQPSDQIINLYLSAQRRLSMPPGSTAAVTFADSALIRVGLQNGDDWSVDATLRPLAEAWAMFDEADIESVEAQAGQPIALPEKDFSLECRIGVDGVNNPRPITIRFEFKRGVDPSVDPVQTGIRWRLDGITP